MGSIYEEIEIPIGLADDKGAGLIAGNIAYCFKKKVSCFVISVPFHFECHLAERFTVISYQDQIYVLFLIKSISLHGLNETNMLPMFFSRVALKKPQYSVKSKLADTS